MRHGSVRCSLVDRAKAIYKITYPNGKVYIGMDLTGTLTYPIHIFIMGANEWRDLPEWPPATDEQVLYLQPDGELGEAEPQPAASPSMFTYDPADPTPVSRR